MPNVGIITLEDAETGEQIEINTADRTTRARFAELAQKQEVDLLTHLAQESTSTRSRSGPDEDYLPALRSFFKQRERRLAVR